MESFRKQLKTPGMESFRVEGHREFSTLMEADPNEFSVDRARLVTDAALLTFALHCESRIASLAGEGFYTIGPCGEELTSVLGVLLETTDPMALHYRHVAANVARQMKAGESLDTISQNRARGYCVSRQDPVTGGAHCALGGGSHDFLVTSTLASQASPALGRALGGVLANHLSLPCSFPKDFVSFFSLGDGSVNNGHFLSANNLSEFAAFRGVRVPLLTCITDNGVSISLRTHDYLKRQFSKKMQQPVFVARGDDVADFWDVTRKALSYCRQKGRPAALVVTGITRRFGHAATDRQAAYMDAGEIASRAESNVLTGLCAQMVRSGVYSQAELADRFEELAASAKLTFDKASEEPKLTDLGELLDRVSAPLSPMPSGSIYAALQPVCGLHALQARSGETGSKAHVMRKHMTSVFDELLGSNPNMVYLGEDVRHGGYYLVTEGLARKYSSRIFDFPPDETSLMGVGMGMVHAGLLPVVEMPYAKYLDCGLDMFSEAALMHWLSNGKQPNGMIVRLQGFGRGVFGGNFHTHNMLHMPPGVDVVCYSNGADYAAGMRYALQQAKSGRVVMSVDCTELLNLREISANIPWEFPLAQDYVSFDTVFVHGAGGDSEFLVVTYGNGVLAAIQAQNELRSMGIFITVVDCPLLSDIPQGLRDIVGQYQNILFADVCKEGAAPLANHMLQLMNAGAFIDDRSVRCIAAPRTYNPLGNTLTFLNKDNILAKVLSMRHSAAN